MGMSTMNHAEHERAKKALVFWRQVGDIIGETLQGYEYQEVADFSNNVVVDGKIGSLLVEQADRISEVEEALEEALGDIDHIIDRAPPKKPFNINETHTAVSG
jgi:hypothetical protein